MGRLLSQVSKSLFGVWGLCEKASRANGLGKGSNPPSGTAGSFHTQRGLGTDFKSAARPLAWTDFQVSFETWNTS